MRDVPPVPLTRIGCVSIRHRRSACARRRSNTVTSPARRLPLQKDMSSTHSQVVIGFDFGHSAQQALYRAIGIAARAPFHVFHFVCAIDPHFPPSAVPTKHVDYEYAERVQKEMTAVIEKELRAANITERVHFFVHARIGKPAVEILTLSRDVGADLIIVGTKGLTGVERLVLGSVAERVVREAGCTVEVARETSYEHVDLLNIVDATEHRKYVPPHRYYYENHIVTFKPAEWPLY
jgi:nucleotide-binding universal stress UspA family protein